MTDEKRFLVDVGMKNLPFPMRVVSRSDPEGQQTVANISITARIMHEFQARWIDTFIHIVHDHKGRIGTSTLRTNITDYLRELQAQTVTVDFEYPFFIEKTTPVSKQQNLVRYLCCYTAKVSAVQETPKIRFRIEVPVITTYPASSADKPGGLFGQLSVVDLQVETEDEVYPEDLVDLIDRHALMPVYSFMSEEDQMHVIQKVHSEMKTSVVMTDEIKDDLRRDKNITWYSVSVSNYGMLHSYSTVIGTEKSMWVPFSGYE